MYENRIFNQVKTPVSQVTMLATMQRKIMQTHRFQKPKEQFMTKVECHIVLKRYKHGCKDQTKLQIDNPKSQSFPRKRNIHQPLQD